MATTGREWRQRHSLTHQAVVDYSFVTGETEPVLRGVGDRLFAGGKQMGGAIAIETLKPVSQGYLSSLWAQEAWNKRRSDSLDTLTDRFGRWFTAVVVAVALGAAIGWWSHDPGRALKAAVSVLIVACPCALALAAPFATGTAQRILGRHAVFLRDARVVEALGRVDAVVFDKTGTLTDATAAELYFTGRALAPSERDQVAAVACGSAHPHAVRLARTRGAAAGQRPVLGFREVPGCGLEGCVDGRRVRLGSAAWLREGGVGAPEAGPRLGAAVHVAIEGEYRGCFELVNPLRPRVEAAVRALGGRYRLHLLSGDRGRDRERDRWAPLFAGEGAMRFEQSPEDKRRFLEALQAAGQRVLMVGDGLNDAGALKQADVGVAVVAGQGAFSPASDVILEATQVRELPALLHFGQRVLRVVGWGFVISSVYNVAGIGMAAAGWLSPLFCAVLMPLSSISVVGFVCGATRRAAAAAGFAPGAPLPERSGAPG